ncbi:MAG: hypothetical protein HQM10_03750 [Candidatus Riflebacteria bacterium]|nr:hypothetical protein [Candidatus Riflebacteria bacterium]
MKFHRYYQTCAAINKAKHEQNTDRVIRGWSIVGRIWRQRIKKMKHEEAESMSADSVQA